MQMNYTLEGELRRGKVPWNSFPIACMPKIFFSGPPPNGTFCLNGKEQTTFPLQETCKCFPPIQKLRPKTKLLSTVATLPSLPCPLPRFKVCIDLIVHTWQAALQRHTERGGKRKVTLWRALSLGGKTAELHHMGCCMAENMLYWHGPWVLQAIFLKF